MSRAYLRKDPGFFERKAIAQDYPPAAYVALDGVLCLADSQPQRGRFRDERVLRALLGKYGRWVLFLIEKKDLIQLSDGRLYVDGWDEWQEGDLTVKERVARVRSRKRAITAPTVTSDVTSDVTDRDARESRPASASLSAVENEESATLRAQGPIELPVKGMNGQTTSVRIDEGEEDAPPELLRLQRLAADLTGQPFVNPYNGFMQKALAEQLQPHGFDRVERAWRKVAALHLAKGTARPTLRQLVIDADDILNPLLDRRDVEQAGRAEEEAERQRRRDEANRRRNDEYRVMAGMKPAGKPEPEPA